MSANVYVLRRFLSARLELRTRIARVIMETNMADIRERKRKCILANHGTAFAFSNIFSTNKDGVCLAAEKKPPVTRIFLLVGFQLAIAIICFGGKWGSSQGTEFLWEMTFRKGNYFFCVKIENKQYLPTHPAHTIGMLNLNFILLQSRCREKKNSFQKHL